MVNQRGSYRSGVGRKSRNLHCFVLSLEQQLGKALNELPLMRFDLFRTSFAYPSESWFIMVSGQGF